jgi:transglutaminase-like putative cysteine protease
MKPPCHIRAKRVLSSLLVLLLVNSAIPATGADTRQQFAAPTKASFRVTNEFKIQLPKGAKRVRVWFAVPQEDAESAIRDLSVSSEYPVHIYRDSWRNTVGYEEINTPKTEQITIREQFTLTRSEIRNTLDPHQTRSLTEAERNALARYLEPSTHVVINDQIRALAASITGGETNPILAARKLYNWTLDNVDYWVKDPDHLKASEVGSTEYCLRTKTGNCTDFHSLFASLARASGIPTRMVYGSLLKPTLNGVAVDGSYHCWIQFFAPGYGWLPLDVSLANIYGKEFPLTEKNKKLVDLTTATGYHGLDRSKIDYYFGNLDDRRVVWSEGRDLIMQPPQDDGPVNALTKMYVEIDGKPSADWTRQFTYKELPN